MYEEGRHKIMEKLALFELKEIFLSTRKSTILKVIEAAGKTALILLNTAVYDISLFEF